MVVNYALIGSRIKELRKAQGLSQEALAAFSELSSVFVSNIECNRKHPSLETLLSIADALGVTADALLVGNQQNCHYEYDADLAMLFYDCSATEKRFLFDILKAAKEAIRKNGWIMGSHTAETK